MIGNTDPTIRPADTINPELAKKYGFNEHIPIQLARAAAALRHMSQIGEADYAERHTVGSPELVSQLAAFLSAITALNAYKEFGQRVLMKLVSNEELSESEAIFLEQIQHVHLPTDITAE